MEASAPSRREFVKRSIAAAVGGALAARVAPAGEARRHAVRLGGPIFGGSQDPEEMALAHRKLGYRAASRPGGAVNDAPRIKAISAAFEKHDVVIAEVGRWCNLLDPDAAKRKENLRAVTEGLALADARVEVSGPLRERAGLVVASNRRSPESDAASISVVLA